MATQSGSTELVGWLILDRLLGIRTLIALQGGPIAGDDDRQASQPEWWGTFYVMYNRGAISDTMLTK